jgi:nitroimidazol reductase NimA-like FMN-containing flavoprotein (pyridoxamine 5'-phosphate oxidase superfamily)
VSAPSPIGIPGDLTAEVEAASRAFLVSRRRDGAPTVHPLTPIVRDGVVHFNTYRKSAKVTNMLRDPRVACVLASADLASPYQALECRGTAELLDASEVGANLISFGDTSEVMRQEDLERVRRNLTSGKRVYLRIVPQEWRRCEPLAEPAELGADPSDAPDVAAWERSLVASPIAMDAQEATRFLGEPRVAVLGTVDPMGAPRGQPARYAVGPGVLDLAVPRSSPLLADLEGDPRAAATVEEFPTYDAIRGVMVHGPARPADPGSAGTATFLRVRLLAERVLSFDFSKVRRSP